ncbi:MAG: hypothetical protein ACR2ID_10530 [Chthoniobacterales bacterium]
MNAIWVPAEEMLGCDPTAILFASVPSIFAIQILWPRWKAIFRCGPAALAAKTRQKKTQTADAFL